MRILFVAPYVPNIVRVRPYQLIRSLARRGNSVTLVTVWTTAAERADLDRLRAEGVRVRSWHLTRWRSTWNCFRAAPGATPLQAAYCWHPVLAQEITAAVCESHFDVVHVEHLRAARYAVAAARASSARRGAIQDRHARPAVVWDSVDCISHLFEQAARSSRSLRARIMTRLELPRTRRFEAWMIEQVDRVLVTSDVDRAAMQSLRCDAERRTSRTAISVVPNGVDLDYFTPPEAPREPATLIITGKMSYHANRTAVLHLVDDIMPRVWARRPEVRVSVVGQNPAPEIRRLGSRGPSGPGDAGHVSVTGTVADIRPHLRRSTIAVAPLLYGAGIQNKVLEAMACGTPVISSPIAASALSAYPQRDLVIAADAERFAAAVLELLDDPVRRARMGTAGRQYVEAHHAWPAVACRLEEVYQASMPALSSRGVQLP